MENKEHTIFWGFLKEHKIEIPIIQRDYAQGRIGKEELRKSFLRDLKSALDSGKEMKLDFVYGTNESDIFNPLDGQQRLTTLWLLHWYVAYRLQKLGPENGTPNEISKIFQKFTYETRVSSREFCKKLSAFNIPQQADNKQNIAQHIQNQTWFRSAWKQDPTIQSMLRMLSGTPNKDIKDGIEEVFKGCSDTLKDYWEKMTNDSCPIVFYYLDLLGLKQSDDLYIKMNARGEQLTSFENLKADLIGYINEQANDSNSDEEERKKWEKLLDPKEGIPIKMDTTWTNIFWENRFSDDRIDEIYFAFINRFFFNELFIAKKDKGDFLLDIDKEDDNSTYRYLNDSANPNDYDTKIAYSGLDVYKYKGKREIPVALFEKLQKVLNLCSNNIIPECKWDTTFHFIPQYDKTDDKESEIENNAGVRIKKVTTLNQVQRIVFFAVCKYFSEGESDQVSLKRWMRVVWNLVSGEDWSGLQIRSTSAMRPAIKFIDKLDSHNVYKSLREHEDNIGTSKFDLICKEEIDKAKKIIDDKNELKPYDGDIIEYQTEKWEDVIIEAENYCFFKGAIRFLFTDGEGNVDWKNFDTKWQNAKQYFDQNGVKKKYLNEPQLLCALLSRIEIDNSLWFANGKGFWHDMLLNDKYRKPMSEILAGNTNVDNDCKEDWLKSSLLSKVLVDSDKWHILSDWRGYKVLTRYSYRQSGTVSCPEQIVVLDHPRNKILKNFDPEDKIDGTCYFYGWDIIFRYNDHNFQWWGEPNDTILDVYLMKSNNRNDGWEHKEDVNNKKGPDEDKYYCFKVDAEETVDSFTPKLDALIEAALKVKPPESIPQ
jgi:hypothetical protein